MTEQPDTDQGEHEHEYHVVEDGDPSTPYYSVYRVCWICGAEPPEDE